MSATKPEETPEQVKENQTVASATDSASAVEKSIPSTDTPETKEVTEVIEGTNKLNVTEKDPEVAKLESKEEVTAPIVPPKGQFTQLLM